MSASNLLDKPKQPANYWAIQASDSEFRVWNNTGKTSTVQFKWSEFKGLNSIDIEFILEAVHKRYPNEEALFKVSLALSVFETHNKVQEGDGILQINNESEDIKSGAIISKLWIPATGVMNIEIAWDLKKVDHPFNIKPFQQGVQIQKLSVKPNLNVKNSLTGRHFKKDAIAHFEKAKSSKLYKFGKQEKDTEMPNYAEVILFYGTNRSVNDINSINDRYGVNLDKLKFGTCTVTIPKGHEQGEIERPSFWKMQFSENADKHVVIKSIVEESKADLISSLSAQLKESNEKSALIFIHGFNVSFDEAARRTGQIAWDIPFKGVTGFYSWPSNGKTKSYLKDIERADASAPRLEEFIEAILDTGVTELHIMAHSMGNRVMTAALNNLGDKEELAQKLKLIRQIILAAPDIDQAVFRDTILPKFQNVGASRTIYASTRDKALWGSEIIREGMPRLGDAGESLFIENGIDTIDASVIKTDTLNHSYVFESKETLTDLFYLLNQGLEPVKRRLRLTLKGQLKYWLFPK